MKCSLGISNFLEEISSLSHSIGFLYFFALICREGFFISPCYFLELCIQMGISFLYSFTFSLDFPVAQMVNNLPVRQETRVQSLGWEVPLEKAMVIHSSILAWRIPWTEKPGGLQSMGLQRVGHDWVTNTHRTSKQLNCDLISSHLGADLLTATLCYPAKKEGRKSPSYICLLSSFLSYL